MHTRSMGLGLMHSVAGIALACMLPTQAFAAASEPEAPLKVPQPNTEQKPLFVPIERPMPSSDAPGSFQMRCWQRGQLLFTENNLSEPTIAAMPGRVVTFNEKSGNAVYMIEVAESLCLIKRGKVGR